MSRKGGGGNEETNSPAMSVEEQLAYFGRPNPGSTHDDVKTQVLRVMMRHPSKSVLRNLYKAHSAVKGFLSGATPPQLYWLLGGSSKLARGGFGRKDDSTTANTEGMFRNLLYSSGELQRFLREDPKNISSSRLITGLETILTAIGYRGVAAAWCPDHDPKVSGLFYAQSAIAFSKKIMQSIYPFKVYPIECTYPEKAQDVLDESSLSSPPVPGSVIIGAQYTCSAASDAGSPGIVADQGPSRVFRKAYTDASGETRLSWAAQVIKAGFDVRAHVSGTLPLALSALEAVFNASGESLPPDNHFGNSELATLCAVLFIPAFVRGDYHSFIETVFGIDYALKARRIRNTDYEPDVPKPVPDQISIPQAFDIGTGWCVNGVSGELQGAVEEGFEKYYGNQHNPESSQDPMSEAGSDSHRCNL